jgi:hypothetical protein
VEALDVLLPKKGKRKKETSAWIPGKAGGVEALDVLLQLRQEGLEALGEVDVCFVLALELHYHLLHSIHQQAQGIKNRAPFSHPFPKP